MAHPCQISRFEAVDYITCIADPVAMDVRLFHASADKQPWSNVEGLVAEQIRVANAPLMAMNAGMYHADMAPVGLLVEDGEEISPLNTADDIGNFFLKPNGVFFIDQSGRAAVMETSDFAEADIIPRIATQSGPMLVVDGHLHPKFLADGTSKYIRNGVGVRADGNIVFAISRDAVNLHTFARAFRGQFNCPNALFFDGGVSTMVVRDQVFKNGDHPAGPVVAVFAK